MPEKASETVKSVISGVFPLLMVVTPVANTLTVLLGGYRTIQHIKNKQFSSAICTVVFVATSILFPPIGIGCSYAYHIWNGSLKRSDKGFSFVVIMWSSHIVSLAYATPLTLTISLIARAVYELYNAREDYKDKQYIECTGMIAMAALRLVFAGKHMTTLFAAKKPQFVLMDKPLEESPQPHSRKLLSHSDQSTSIHRGINMHLDMMKPKFDCSEVNGEHICKYKEGPPSIWPWGYRDLYRDT